MIQAYPRVSDLDNYLFMIYLKAFIKDAIRRKVDIRAIKKQVKAEMRDAK